MKKQVTTKYSGLPAWLQRYDLTAREWNGLLVYVGNLPVSVLQMNTGQIEGLPSNPREWTFDDMERLKASLTETPELYIGRGCLVYPHPSDPMAVVLGGNMRFSASESLRHETVPVCIYPQDTSIEKLKEIVAKDNGTFGRFDYDKLSSEWDDMPLTDWGIPAWKTEGEEASGSTGKSDGGASNAKDDGFDEGKEHIKVRCKKGDVWQLGNHRLMCGDSIDLQEVIKLMGGVWQICY